MKIILKNLFVILFLGLIPCGCNNDPTSPEEGHVDADGFVLEDENGNQIKTAFTEAELKPKDGEKVIKQKYGGCPKHPQQNQDDDDFGF